MRATQFTQEDKEQLVLWLKEQEQQDWIEKFRENDLKLLESQVFLKRYCCKQKIFRYYVEKYVSESETIGHACAFLVAKTKRINLYIWENKAGSRSDLILIDKTIAKRPTHTIHMFHSSNPVHFDQLEIVEELDMKFRNFLNDLIEDSPGKEIEQKKDLNGRFTEKIVRLIHLKQPGLADNKLLAETFLLENGVGFAISLMQGCLGKIGAFKDLRIMRKELLMEFCRVSPFHLMECADNGEINSNAEREKWILEMLDKKKLCTQLLKSIPIPKKIAFLFPNIGKFFTIFLYFLLQQKIKRVLIL